MNDDLYLRSIEDLEKIGSKWWPKEVRDEANKTSILKTLLDTQDEFISILKLTNRDDLKSIFRIMEASNFSMRCFLKHMMILTGIELEQVQHINKNFAELFPIGKMTLNDNVSYYFHVLPIKRSLTGEGFKLDCFYEEIVGEERYLLEDLIMLLLYHVKFANELHVADFIGANSIQMRELKDFMTFQLITNWSKHNHVSLWSRMKNKIHKLCA